MAWPLGRVSMHRGGSGPLEQQQRRRTRMSAPHVSGIRRCRHFGGPLFAKKLRRMGHPRGWLCPRNHRLFPSAAKAVSGKRLFIAAVNRCATQKRVQGPVNRCATQRQVQRRVNRCATQKRVQGPVNRCATQKRVQERVNRCATQKQGQSRDGGQLCKNPIAPIKKPSRLSDIREGLRTGWRKFLCGSHYVARLEAFGAF